MEEIKKEESKREYFVVDIMHILRVLWNKIWMILLIAFMAAVAGFSWATFVVTPKYSSQIMLYVNNNAFSLGDMGFSVSSSQLTAAQSLVKTYTVILKNRTTLETVIQKTGVPYDYEELYGMIEASDVNKTEILKVTVTSTDPEEAAKIVNCIAEILPQRISEVIEGASMTVIDTGIVDPDPVAPNTINYTLIACVLGGLTTAAVLAIFAVLDDTIHDEEYIQQTYNYPILAKVPDLLSQSNSKKNDGYY